ncbi:MAG: isoleucine--tRNA ligase [Bacilli bacterium]
MIMFKELKKEKVEDVEASFSKYWQEKDILNKSIENKDKYFVFYDGPATANGMPGLHHMVAKFLKDAFCKYKTMQGYKVLRKVGWDTHGLPVEVQVEKQLGFNGKKDIEKYGIEKFNAECRKTVWANEKAFSDLTTKMGQFIDLEHPYVTYDNSYIETEWWILKKFFDAGLFYEGQKILPYCPRCGTGLATHEVAQGYKEISVDTVIVCMKKKDEDAYFLVWTTTPWTLIANVALCVNPNEEYVKVKSQGHKFILAKKLANKILGEDIEILETYKGSELEYVEYEQLIPSLSVDKKAFYVTCDEYVTMEDGTGIVHLAPAFGQDDYNVGRKYNLPYLNPVGDDGKYKEGLWKGQNVFEADLEVIKYLKKEDKLFKKQKIVHNYPHCWRCDSPLIYYSKPSFYLEITKIKDKIIEANSKVNWYPEYVGEKRFANWLENLNDWAISRNRYWGTPLPLWRCSCGHSIMIGSKKELIELATTKVSEDIDLHRPYVDDIHIKCPICGKEMTRVNDVIDCWFDSGAMPFAQYHYPFENDELFNTQFPADFIAEGIDQTRGWFYSLLVISTFIKGVSPYKNVLVNELLLDKNGQKMHKSKGNAIEPFTIISKYGADIVRFYLPYVSPVWTPLKFDEDGLKEVHSKFFNPLKNTYTFFQMYANIDNIDPRNFKVATSDLENIDKWLLSKYNKLIKNVTSAYEEYDLNKVVKLVTEFVSDDLSNWYIRRNRKRFWQSELDNSKMSVYQTTYEVLIGICKIVAPISPFITEEIYQNLTDEESVHLASFPIPDEKLINEELENKMELVRNLISLGRNAREEAKIKVRQPISEVIIDGKNKKVLADVIDLIKEELNVKEIVFAENLNEYMNFSIKPNFKNAGSILGSKMPEFVKYLNSLKEEEINNIRNNMDLEFEGTKITEDLIDIKINAKEGFNIATENNNFIILNTTLTEELLNEGLAREFVSKIQQLRKTENFDVEDRINIYIDANKDFINQLMTNMEYIKAETLCLNFKEDKKASTKLTINEYEILVTLERLENK